jgi:hypothetical protein
MIDTTNDCRLAEKEQEKSIGKEVEEISNIKVIREVDSKSHQTTFSNSIQR